MLEYKVVESSLVTDEELQRVLNDAVSAGWNFDGMQFAMRESSKRPAMAFVIFTRRQPAEPVGAGGRVLPLRTRKKDRGT